MFLLEIFLTIKAPAFFQKNKNIRMFEEVPALQNENSHLNNLVTYANALCAFELLASASLVKCMNYRNLLRPIIKLR